MKNIEIFFQFDTTGSMYSCLNLVKKNVESALVPLFKEIPNLKIGIGANGDYCDGRIGSYITKYHLLSNDLYSLTQFVRNVERTNGGDSDECYELVLQEIQTQNWSLNSEKIFVLIADANPHPVGYVYNGKRYNIDWRKEATKMRDLGIKVYTVQCLSHWSAGTFYSELARMTDGVHLKLEQFNEVIDLLLAVVYKQAGPSYLEKFEKKVENENRMTRSMDATFRTLTNRDPKTGRFVSTKKGLEPVSPSRFQILKVETDQDIRSFAEDNDLEFAPGRGFYEFTKTEDIQEKKEVVLRDKKSGDMFTGDTARTIIGVPPGTRGHLRPDPKVRQNYDIFVQSTSYNRKLKKNTRFLYEVDNK